MNAHWLTSTKSGLLALATLGTCLLFMACADSAKRSVAQSEPSADEKALEQSVIDFMERFNKHDAKSLAELFAPDARMVYADGEQVDGREAIEQSFADAFAESPKSAVSIVVDSIRQLTPDVAVEEGTTTMFPDGETLTTRSRYTVLHVKKDGKWHMQAVRVVADEVVSAYGQLQSLDWLIGDWIDEGRDEIVEATFRWDDNKSFLLEEFRVVREGAEVLKGTQRIGWDPQTKKVRSWTFDTGGGFGESTWTPAGDRWICQFSGVTPEGDSVSATRTLTKDTPDRIFWSATDRLVGNEQLPDLDVTVVRKPNIHE